MHPQGQLAELLNALFIRTELTAFLAGLDRRLVDSLPSERASAVETAHAAAAALERTGHLSQPAFWELLRQERPLQSGRIDVVARMFLPEPPCPPDPPCPKKKLIERLVFLMKFRDVEISVSILVRSDPNESRATSPRREMRGAAGSHRPSNHLQEVGTGTLPGLKPAHTSASIGPPPCVWYRRSQEFLTPSVHHRRSVVHTFA